MCVMGGCMSKIGANKRDKIKEEILRFLYDEYPAFHFTNKISYELARNNEFVLGLMKEMVKNELVSFMKDKGGRGERVKWKLKEEVYQKYKELV